MSSTRNFCPDFTIYIVGAKYIVRSDVNRYGYQAPEA